MTNKMEKIKEMKPVFIDTVFKIKAAGEGDGPLVLEGIANSTSKDRSGDVVTQEAWNKGGLDNYLKNPVVLAFHKYDKPIGFVTEHSVEYDGLHVVAEISKAAGEIYNLIKEGIVRAFSVGFRVKDADYDPTTDIFVIKDLELYEISVVSVPANADSIFSVRKSFEKEEDYNSFKSLFIQEPPVVTEEPVVTKEEDKGENKMSDKDKISLTPEELAAIEKKAAEKALADAEAARVAAEARAEEMKKIAIEVGTSGTEKLLADLETRFKEENSSLLQSIEDLKTQVTEKAGELEALQKNKMVFDGAGRKSTLTEKEIDTAVLTAKIMGVPIEKTKYFDQIKEKTGDHLANTTGSPQGDKNDWETEFTTRLYEDIKNRTIIEPLFRNTIQMNARTMVFPWNPDAGFAEWIDDTDYKSTDGSSTGTGATHLIKDNYLKAEKLAAKEFLGYEEEEDAIIALAPLIRDAVMRRMVRSTDMELLRGDVGTDNGSGSGLINGVATLAADVNAGADYQYTQSGTFGSANPITVADLQQTRRLMSNYGLMPGDLVYVVNQSVMFDLLEDPDFRTMDLVGTNATILRGQIGAVNGSPVIISDAFPTHAASTLAAVALNTSNYLFGELRGMMVERDRDVYNQKNVMIATRRFAFTEIIPAVAKATTDRSACANLLTASA